MNIFSETEESPKANCGIQPKAQEMATKLEKTNEEYGYQNYEDDDEGEIIYI